MEKEIILKPGVSAVVCCYNSAGVIIPTIKALTSQRIPPGIMYEVILVDNNCTDNTVQLAENIWKKENLSYPLRIVKESQPGLIYARKSGIFSAANDILLFVDDDNILEPDWVERLMDMYSRWPNVGAIGGFIEPLFEDEKEGKWKRPPWFENFSSMYACTPIYQNPQLSTFKQTLYGAGLSIRTHIARSIFNSQLPFFLVGRTQNTLNRGDDSEICLRIALMGWKLWYESTLKMKHYILKHRVNWEYVLQARKGGGHADIILKIYLDLLERKTPLKYFELAAYIGSLWKEFWKLRTKHKDLVKLSREGESINLRNHYLQGLTEGFLKFDKKEYNTIREKICIFFMHRERLSHRFLTGIRHLFSKFF